MVRIKIGLITILFCIASACSLNRTIQNSSGNKKDKQLNDGLIACYPFNGNAEDISGNHNDGKVRGAVLTNGRNGQMNTAYYFDGVDDHIYINDSENLRITGQISMSVWFKTDYSLPFAGIICKADPIEPRRGYLIDINADNNVRTDICFDHSKAECGTLMSPEVLTDNKWHHVTVTYNGSDLLLFIDGKLTSKTVYERGLQANNEPLLIGWDMNTWLSHRHFKGSIDDVRIYNRALKKNEIRRLYRMN
jgi:hypothetical protein